MFSSCIIFFLSNISLLGKSTAVEANRSKRSGQIFARESPSLQEYDWWIHIQQEEPGRAQVVCPFIWLPRAENWRGVAPVSADFPSAWRGAFDFYDYGDFWRTLALQVNQFCIIRFIPIIYIRKSKSKKSFFYSLNREISLRCLCYIF